MKEISVDIEAFENDFAVFKIGGSRVLWSKKELPDGIKKGDSMVIRVLKEPEAESIREKTAKELLNELLNNHEKS
jgi:hypothetical protein